MGKVIEVVSGDTIVVLDPVSSEFRRFYLASIRAPRLGRGSEPDAPYAYDAREFVRKKLIGRKVNVKVEYVRSIPAESGKTPLPPQAYASISRGTGPIKGDGQVRASEDIGGLLVDVGLATVIRHRSDEERATLYDEYLARERAAIEARKGLHKGGEGPTRRVNDLTAPDARKRCKELATFYEKAGPMHGIVEYLSTGSRFRVYLVKEGALINFSLKDTRCPAPSRRTLGPTGVAEVTGGEPYGNEALQFSKESFLQRNVDITVEGIDRVGCFLGAMKTNFSGPSGTSVEVDAAEVLLENGYAKLSNFFDPNRDNNGDRLAAAQDTAFKAKRGLWENYEEPKEEEVANLAGKEPNLERGLIVEVGFGGRIFLQTSAEGLERVRSSIDGLNLHDDETPLPLAGIRVKDLVLARFSADGQWYRAKVVEKDDHRLRVSFIDYGNEEWISPSSVRTIPPASPLSSIPPCCRDLVLANVVVPSVEDDFCMEAGEELRNYCFMKEAEVKMWESSGPGPTPAEVTLTGADCTVTQHLLRKGLARLIRRRTAACRTRFTELGPDEAIGRATRMYLWRFGDPYDSDEDEDEVRKGANGDSRRGL